MLYLHQSHDQSLYKHNPTDHDFQHYFIFSGNALGYVRMVRSGGLHSVSNSIRFVPDLEDIQNFEKITLDEGITDPEVIEAAKTLDEVVGNLTKSFTEGSEYFQVFLNALSFL